MALFGGSRDVNLFHTINSELMKDIIQTEVAYYKFALQQTTANVYGEAVGKNYFEPLKIACLISRADQDWSVDDFGPNVNQSISFRFLKNELKDINLVAEIGDLILFKNNFYEVDSRVENQFFMGRDPDYALSSETIDHGDSFSIILNTHLSRVEKLNLIPLRGGRYPTINLASDGQANVFDLG